MARGASEPQGFGRVARVRDGHLELSGAQQPVHHPLAGVDQCVIEHREAGALQGEGLARGRNGMDQDHVQRAHLRGTRGADVLDDRLLGQRTPGGHMYQEASRGCHLIAWTRGDDTIRDRSHPQDSGPHPGPHF
ncbi:hypothetical protein [Myxococcus qinghaiensis]|uniref:hypothetical protein n=1 Tax=Myxococcus qinghaiensis TaxID=2906758 RepID=UPI0020A76029|nr:hypothetical protein [Myxococcus qinghaiensis]MCP3165615.1 hypothetical protein [Myxococcus qinghaiensis]